jgi:hypothetical protein
MSIQRQIVLRYRDEGYVRFALPSLLCAKTIAESICGRLLAIEGIYQVNLSRRNKKLSVHFQETICSFHKLAKDLYQLIADLEKNDAFQPQASLLPKRKWETGEKIKNIKAARWIEEKYTEAKETVQAARVLGKLGLKKPKAFVKDPETTIINFLNDILVLYVIKVHWNRITQQWIPHPIQYRYEWTAAFYLMYLLMRSRRPKK